MGVRIHRAAVAVVHAYDEAREGAGETWRFLRTQAEILEDRVEVSLTSLMVGPVVQPVNGSVTYAILPSGSKAGWDVDDAHVELLESFVELMGDVAHVVWVDFGETDGGPQVRS